jgi:integrase
MKKLFPLDEQKALKVWRSQKYHTLMFLLVSSGMRSGEVRALKWSDVLWEDSGLLITKAVKNSGAVGTVKEKKEKVCPHPRQNH